ncbi:hypothetical protein AXF42_Ash013678 [Apostasia shenzhenica]|uniref:Uncharacterized protein n=1 Tax=Apostasia shenzhenica TaxID=1088818 RepID=A0A2I0A4J7_9ASPA|nr:hypothetical protein AXF42_Ash013678 [Apostasia shenzhenica]
MQDVNHYHHDNKECRNVCEVRQQKSRSSRFDDQPLQNSYQDVNQNEKMMALVRQKFIEAKHLASDEKLLESKEFQDVLEILNSNRDLFLKFLEEPNSVLSKRLSEFNLIPPPNQTNRITVLKPSKKFEPNAEKLVKKLQCDSKLEIQNNLWSSSFIHPRYEKLSQPTRIVVLKPSPRKDHETKSTAGPNKSSPEQPQWECFYRGSGSGDSLSRHRRDESLLSSVSSNGFVGDESLCNRLEDCIEDTGDLIKLEATASKSRHSWEYLNVRNENPLSFSFMSPTSYSKESSVIREAKKRLSERLAFVALNETSREQIQEQRSANTLGEMLAIPEAKMETRNFVGAGISGSRSCGREEDFSISATSFIGRTKDENTWETSTANLSGSKFVPSSSSSCEKMCLNQEDSDNPTIKTVACKEITKSKTGISFFKERVLGLFFSKIKKADVDKSFSSPLINYENGLPKRSDELSQAAHLSFPEESQGVHVEAGSEQMAVLSHEEPSTSIENPGTVKIHEKFGMNQDQPSPTSVLESPFEDGGNNSGPILSEFPHADNPRSAACTLPWGDSCSELSSPRPLKHSRAFSKAREEDWEDFIFIKNLLSAAGLDNNDQSTIFNRWCSSEIPLDSKLRDKFADRSNHRLLFDFVNSVLLEIGHSAELGGAPVDDISLASQVLFLYRKSRFSGDIELASIKNDINSQIVETLLRKEVGGIGWSELVKSETNIISKDIGGQVLDDLVVEAMGYRSLDSGLLSSVMAEGNVGGEAETDFAQPIAHRKDDLACEVKRKQSLRARYLYGFIFFATNLLAWFVRDYGHAILAGSRCEVARVGGGGLLSSGIMCLYIVFLCWSAIQSEPAAGRSHSMSMNVDGITILSFLLAICAIALSTFSMGIDSDSFQFTKREIQTVDDIPYKYELFHFIFSTGAMYFAMLFISWDLDHPTKNVEVDFSDNYEEHINRPPRTYSSD